MQIEGVSTASGQAAQKQARKDELGKDDFLKLLVTQLQNQDPLNPTDNTEFVAQLAQFSTLEGITNIQKAAEGTKSSIDAMQNYGNASLIGRQVKAESGVLTLTDRPVRLGYSLSGAAASVKAAIKDASGLTVRTMDLGARPAGDHEFVWDGKDNSGMLLGPGNYAFYLSGAGTDGKQVGSSTYVTDTVTGISLASGTADIMVGSTPISRDKIKAIY